MQDRPLTIPSLLARVEANFGHKRVITGGVHETVATWAEVAPRYAVRRMRWMPFPDL